MMMAESIFDGTQSINTKNLTEEEKRAKAEIEKIKGNEALKSGVTLEKYFLTCRT